MDVRAALLDTAETSALALARCVNELIDVATFYQLRYGEEELHGSIEVAHAALLIASHYRSIPTRLIEWRAALDPVLSREGFRLNVINELHINADLLVQRFTSRSIELTFTMQLFKSHLQELLHCDEILTP